MKTIHGTAYLQIVGVRTPWAPDDAPPSSVKVARVTQKRPEEPVPGAMVVKVTIEMPAAAFMPLEPAATIVVPAEFIDQPITVEASDPREET